MVWGLLSLTDLYISHRAERGNRAAWTSIRWCHLGLWIFLFLARKRRTIAIVAFRCVCPPPPRWAIRLSVITTVNTLIIGSISRWYYRHGIISGSTARALNTVLVQYVLVIHTLTLDADGYTAVVISPRCASQMYIQTNLTRGCVPLRRTSPDPVTDRTPILYQCINSLSFALAIHQYL